MSGPGNEMMGPGWCERSAGDIVLDLCRALAIKGMLNPHPAADRQDCAR